MSKRFTNTIDICKFIIGVFNQRVLLEHGARRDDVVEVRVTSRLLRTGNLIKKHVEFALAIVIGDAQGSINTH